MDRPLKIAGVMLIGLAIAIASGIGSYAAITHVTRGNNPPHKQNTPPETPESTARNETRKRHIFDITNRLFTKVLVLKESVPSNQTGLNALTKNLEGDILIDPKANRPYSFNANQDLLEVGDVYFAIGGSCDNKAIGSNGIGKIIHGKKGSVAANTMLESGECYCQSNL